jgi:hypothetical protein
MSENTESTEISEFEKRLLANPELLEKIQKGIDSGNRHTLEELDLDELP